MHPRVEVNSGCTGARPSSAKLLRYTDNCEVNGGGHRDSNPLRLTDTPGTGAFGSGPAPWRVLGVATQEWLYCPFCLRGMGLQTPRSASSQCLKAPARTTTTVKIAAAPHSSTGLQAHKEFPQEKHTSRREEEGQEDRGSNCTGSAKVGNWARGLGRGEGQTCSKARMSDNKRRSLSSSSSLTSSRRWRLSPGASRSRTGAAGVGAKAAALPFPPDSSDASAATWVAMLPHDLGHKPTRQAYGDSEIHRETERKRDYVYAREREREREMGLPKRATERGREGQCGEKSSACVGCFWLPPLGFQAYVQQ